jgi:hypothetical protein
MSFALISDIHANVPALEAERTMDGIRGSELPGAFADYLATGGRPASSATPAP